MWNIISSAVLVLPFLFEYLISFLSKNTYRASIAYFNHTDLIEEHEEIFQVTQPVDVFGASCLVPEYVWEMEDLIGRIFTSLL